MIRSDKINPKHVLYYDHRHMMAVIIIHLGGDTTEIPLRRLTETHGVLRNLLESPESLGIRQSPLESRGASRNLTEIHGVRGVPRIPAEFRGVPLSPAESSGVRQSPVESSGVWRSLAESSGV